MTALPGDGWDDGTADLIAMVSLAREDGTAPGHRQALEVLVRFADHDAVLASAVKLLAELCEDLGLCQDCFRQYAARAVVR